MRVFVTGGTGFIGANVVRAHLGEGDQVRCLVRASSPTLPLDGLPVEKVSASLHDPQALRKALDGCDVVQHLAGLYDTSPDGLSRMHAVHVDGTRNLLTAARDAGVERFILCSSSITVGFGPRDRPGNEDTPIPEAERIYPPGTPLGVYYATKLQAEAMVREANGQGLETLILNPDYVVGAWDVKPTSGALILAMARRAWIPAHPKGGKCFVTAEDCARAFVRAVDRGEPGRRYLLGNENLTYHRFMNLVARVVGCPPPAMGVPRHATRWGAAVLPHLERHVPSLAGRFDAPVILSMQEERYRDGRRAREELGMPNTPLVWGIEAAWKWFTEHGYIGRR